MLQSLNSACLRAIAEDLALADRYGRILEPDDPLVQDLESLTERDHLAVVMFVAGAQYERKRPRYPTSLPLRPYTPRAKAARVWLVGLGLAVLLAACVWVKVRENRVVAAATADLARYAQEDGK